MTTSKTLAYGLSLLLHASLIGFLLIGTPRGHVSLRGLELTTIELSESYQPPATDVISKQKAQLQKSKLKRISTVKSTQGSPLGSQQLTAKENYLNDLRNFINARKVYPKPAQLLGQKGFVKVAFYVNQQGEVSEPELIQGCPYKKLNDAAIQLIEELGQFKPFPEAIRAQLLKVVLPLNYTH